MWYNERWKGSYNGELNVKYTFKQHITTDNHSNFLYFPFSDISFSTSLFFLFIFQYFLFTSFFFLSILHLSFLVSNRLHLLRFFFSYFLFTILIYCFVVSSWNVSSALSFRLYINWYCPIMHFRGGSKHFEEFLRKKGC